MFLLDWYRELTRIRAEARGLKINLQHEAKEECKSCETLRQQLEIANYEKQQLLNKLLYKPTEEPKEESPRMITKPRAIPWNVRKQLLESEDRERARLMRESQLNQQSNQTNIPSEIELKELETELGIAESARETGTEKRS